jgi:hypothetical protein
MENNKHFEEMQRQTSTNQFQTMTINKDRLQAAKVAFNQADATVFLCIGLHFDHKAGVGIPVVVGAQWVTNEQAIHLLQQALIALDPKLIQDAKEGGKP